MFSSRSEVMVPDFLILVLSETVLVLVLERTMSEPIFDHERLDVYRLSVDHVASSFLTDAYFPDAADEERRG
jgi:hypothetical protein